MHIERRMRSWPRAILAGFATAALVLVGGHARADVKPGQMVTADNAAQVQNLVSPGVFYKVQHGMEMKIIAAERVDWPPPYKDATEKYSGQVRLSSDHKSVIGYVAGQPFPLIDANDPEVAVKISWNNVFRPITTDDYDLRFYDCDSSYEARGEQTRQIDYFQIGHYMGLVGRTEVAPIPVDPDFKATGRYLAVRPLPGAGSQRAARNRLHSLALRGSEERRRHLGA